MEDAQDIVRAVNKVSLFSRLPRWLRAILITLSIITVAYWLIWLFIKIWSLIGKCLHWLSDKKNWWLYTSCILILIIGALVIAQCFNNVKPFTILINNVKELIENVRNYIANIIKG